MDEDEINRGMVVINEIEASSRDEMRCPECGELSIKEHPSSSEYPTKKAAILKASYCSNDSCEKGLLTPDEVDKQYEPSGIGENLTNPKSLLQIGIALVGIVLIASYFLGGPIHSAIFAAPTATVQGSVVDSNGQAVQNATVTLDGMEATTDEEGKYTFEEVNVGEYQLSITPPEKSDMRSFGAEVEVTSEGMNIIGGGVPDRLYSTKSGVLQTQFPSGVTLSDTFKAQETTKKVVFLHESNRENVDVTISPLKQSEIESTSSTTINMGDSATLDLQGTITSATATGTGTTVKDTFTQGQTTDSSGQAILNVRGTMTPTATQIQLGDGAGTSDRKKVLNIQSGDSKTITVNGNVLSMDATIRGGATDAPQQRNDVWTPGDGPVKLTIAEDDAPSTVTLTLKGDISEESKQTSGQLSSQSENITVAPDGSLSPSNAEISFSGGNIQTESVGSDKLSGSAETGDEELTTNITTVDQDGTYTIDYDLSATQNPEYVIGGYTINGEKTELSGSGSESLNLSAGDEVGLWLTLEQEDVGTASHTDNSPIEVTDINTNVRDSGEVAVWPKLNNTSSSSATTEVVYYVDGTEVHSQNYTLSGGETTSYTTQYQDLVHVTDSLSEGIHSIQVNEQNVTIEIGNGSLEYGEGNISGELSYVADQGEIQVDSNDDGNAECTAVASGGTCSISLDQGQNTINLTQNNVSGVNWTVSYTARYGARDIQADMTGDGTNEINYQGVLADGDTVSESLTFPAGTHEIDISTGNDSSIPYNLEWTESGVIDSPTLYVNGEEVANVNESYQGQKDFNIDSEYFESGENTVRLETEDNAEHTVILEWSERGLDTYPEVSLANADVQLCSSRDFSSGEGATCEIDPNKLNTGTQTVQFTRDGSPISDVNFEFSHTGRATPSTITLTDTDSDEDIVFTRSNAQQKDVDGNWTHEKSVNVQSGSSYKVTTSTSSQLDLTGSVTIEATAEREQAVNPRIIIVHPDGSEETIPVPDSSLSDGELTSNSTITINSDQFARGINKIKFVSENNGVYNVEIVGVVDSN